MNKEQIERYLRDLECMPNIERLEKKCDLIIKLLIDDILWDKEQDKEE